MTTVSIHVDESRLEMDSLSGKVFGILYLQVGDEFLPEKGWTDFAGTALSSWANELTRLMVDTSHIAECHFMDGPYWLEVEQVRLGTARITGYEEPSHNSQRQVGEWTVSLQDFVSEVRNALRKLSMKCQQMGWTTKDTANVADALENLESRRIH